MNDSIRRIALRWLRSREQEYGYHATFLGRLDSIASGGLRRSGGSQFGGGYSGHSRGRVFLSDYDGLRFWMSKMEDIAHHSTDWDTEESAGWTPVALRVDITELRERLSTDELGERDSGGDRAWYIEENIPPSLIEVWDGRSWARLSSGTQDEMMDEAIDAAEFESDENDSGEWGQTGWYEMDLELFEPSKKASTPPNRQEIKELVRDVQSVLTPSLLKPVFRRRVVDEGAEPMTGHCYVASEALYHMLGGKGAGLKPVSIRHEGCVHWWLQTADGQIIDPTASQFSTPVPYREGRGRGFMTKNPSKRAQEVIRRVKRKRKD